SLDKHLGRKLRGKTEAETEAERIRAAIRSGTFGQARLKAEATLRELVAEYMRRYVEPRKGDRVAVYRSAFRLIAGTVVEHLTRGPLELGEWPVADITPDTIEQFREVRLRAGKGA